MQQPRISGEGDNIPQFPLHLQKVEMSHLETVTEPKLRRKNIARLALASSLVLLPVGFLASTFAKNEWLQTMKDESGEMVPDVDGCEPFTRPKPIILQEDGTPEIDIMATIQLVKSVAVEDKFKDTRSAAENLNSGAINPFETMRQWGNILVHEQLDFTSAYTGLRIHLYSDREDAFEHFDTANFDKLAHSILDPQVQYDHIAMQEYADCMRQRFINPDGPRELEGERINVYIPSKYGICWVNAQFQEKPLLTKTSNFCDSTGGSIYDFTIAIGPAEYASSWSVIMASSNNKRTAELSTSKSVVHEFGHILTQAAGTRFEFTDNERLVDAYEKEAIKQLYQDGIPHVVTYQPKITSEKLISFFLNDNKPTSIISKE